MPRVPLADFEPQLKKRLEELWGTPPNLYKALGNHPRASREELAEINALLARLERGKS